MAVAVSVGSQPALLQGMLRPNKAAAAVVVAFAVTALARTSAAQVPRAVTDTAKVVTVVPGAQYKAGAFKQWLLGSGWRDVWTTPIQARVLDPATYAGGLKFNKLGGGFHSTVLHLDEENGWREYRFRSVNKSQTQGAIPFRGTFVGKLFQDQVNIFFPAAPSFVDPLMRSIGALHSPAEIYVMKDSPRLEKMRDSTAGLLGTMELKGEEGPDDTPGFAGSTKVKGTEEFFAEDLVKNRENRPDERDFLAVRLVDILLNDPDRTPDNFDWARFGEKGNYTWRALARDRDQAFLDSRGLVATLVVRPLFPKQVKFQPKVDLSGLTFTTHQLDRRVLQRLTAQDFADVARKVQRAVTDSVIDAVIAELPQPWREQTSAPERITSVLRYRRDRLPEIASAFYAKLAQDVDVYGTDEADRFEVVRHADGRVTVVVTDPERKLIVERRDDGRIVTTSDGDVESKGASTPFYSRTFIPGETKEVRLYMLGENDMATVRGDANDVIKVRIIGGKGDDFLADSAGGSATYLYDDAGKNILQATGETNVDTRPWKELTPTTGFRGGSTWKPDWGGSNGWGPAVDYNTGAGIILGFGPRAKRYGFRRLPNEWQASANAWYGTGNGRFGVTGDAEYHLENSPRSFRIEGMATQLEATRFFGYGNNTPRVDRTQNLVDQTVFSVEPAMVWQVGWRKRDDSGNWVRGEDSLRHAGLRPMVGEVRIGPSLGYIDPEPTVGSPLLVSGVRGSEAFGLAGARFGLELDRTDDDAVPTRGWTADVDLSGYPPLLGLDGAFGVARARGTMYVPLSKNPGPNLAFRLGGSVATGDYPAQFAPFVGGRSSLRGYSFRRFAGDAGANGSAELRIPLGEVNFLVRSNVGVFGLADAGRVWYDGANDGGVHTALGGGVWFTAFSRAISLAYAKGETQRLYVKSGLFF